MSRRNRSGLRPDIDDDVRVWLVERTYSDDELTS
jgi:hypothetical protein